MQTKRDIKKKGEHLAAMRKAMGKRSIEIARILETDPGNYCNMEKGIKDCGDRIEKVKKMFVRWRRLEIKRLHNQIKYLESL